MELIHDLLSLDAVYYLGWMLLHSLWLMLILAGLLGLAMLTVPKRMSNTRYAVSVLSLLLMTGSLGIAVLLVPERSTHTDDVTGSLAGGDDSQGDAFAEASLMQLDSADEAPADPGEMVDWIDDTAGLPIDPNVADALDPSDLVNMAEGNTEPKAASGGSGDLLPDEPRGWYARTIALAEPYVVWAVPLWLVGVILFSLWHLGGLIVTQRLRSIGTRPAPDRVNALMHSLMKQMGITRAVTLFESSVVQGPAVIGFFKPVILIPASVLTGLTPQQLEAILAHELAHIKRHDYLVNLVQTLVVTLLFYHPAVWWVSKQIRNERECCCDDIVVRLIDRKLDYATALTQIAVLSNTSRRTHLAVAADSGSLFERIKRMMGVEDTPSGSAIGPKAWLAGLLALLFAVALPITLAAGQGGEVSEREPIAEVEASGFSEEIRGTWYVQYREDNYLSPDAWERWAFEQGGMWSVLDGSYDEQGRRQPGKSDAEAMAYEVDEDGKLTLTVDMGEGETSERIHGTAMFEGDQLVVALTIDGTVGEWILTREERPEAALERRRTDRVKIEQLRKTMSEIGLAWRATMRDHPKKQPRDVTGFGLEWQRLISPFHHNFEVPRDIGTWGEAKRKQWVIDQAGIVYLPRLGDQVIDQPIVLFERPIQGRRSLMVYRDSGESVRVAGMIRSELDALLKKQTGKGLDAWKIAQDEPDTEELSQDDLFKAPRIILGRNHSVKAGVNDQPQPEAMLGPYWEASGEARDTSQLPQALSHINGSRLSVDDVGRRIVLFAGHPDFSGQLLGEVDITHPTTGEPVLLGYNGGFELKATLEPMAYQNKNGWMVFQAYVPRDKEVPERVDLYFRMSDTIQGWKVHGNKIKPGVNQAGSGLGPGVVFTGITEMPAKKQDDYREIILTAAVDRALCQTHQYRLVAEDKQGRALHSVGGMSPSIRALQGQDSPAVMRTRLRVRKGEAVHGLHVERRPIRTVIYRNAALQPGIDNDSLRVEVQPLPVAVDARLGEQNPRQDVAAKAILGKWYVQWSQNRWVTPFSRFSYDFKPSGAIEIVMDGEKLKWGDVELTTDTVKLDMKQGDESLLYNYAINNEGSLILEEKGANPPTFMILTKEPKGTLYHQQQREKIGQGPRAVGEDEKQAADDLLQLIEQTHRVNKSKIKTWVGGALVTDEHVGGPTGGYNMTSLVAFQTDRDQGKRWRWEITAATKTVDGEQVDDPRQISVQDEMIRDHVYYKMSDGFKRADGPWERSMVLLPVEAGAYKIGMKSRSLDPFWYLTQDGKPIALFLDQFIRKRDQGGETLRVTREGSVILIENPLEERQWTRRYRFDLAQGGNLIQVEVNQGKGFWHTDISYEQINGVWVPKRYEQKQETASHGMRRRLVVFRDQFINHPVDQQAFTMEAMGILPGTRVSDHMRGLAYKYPNEQDARRIHYRLPTGQSYTAGGIALHEVAVFDDGGTLAASYTDANGKRIEAAFNGHRHSETRYRMYSGAMHHTHEGAELLPVDAVFEREVIKALRSWVGASFTDEQIAAIRAKQRIAIEAGQRPDLAEIEAWAIQILDGLKAIADHRREAKEQEPIEEPRQARKREEDKNAKGSRRIVIPDLDEPPGIDKRVLDLRSGELLALPEKSNERDVANHFEKLGKGDLLFESASGRSMLIVLRDGVLTYNQDGDRTEVERVIRGVTVYPISPEDESINIKTAEGDVYTLKIVENRGGNGLEVLYARSKKHVPALPGDAAAPQGKSPLVGRWVWCDDKIENVVGVAEIDDTGGLTIFDLDGGAKHFRIEINEDTGVWQLDGTGNNDFSTLTTEFIGKDRIVLKGDEGRELLFREEAYEKIKEQTLRLRKLKDIADDAAEQQALHLVPAELGAEGDDPWQAEMNRLSKLVIKEVGRDAVVQGYEALIAAHPEVDSQLDWLSCR